MATCPRFVTAASDLGRFIVITMILGGIAGAQNTETVLIGDSGCQDSTGAPALSGGAPGAGEIDYTYDLNTGNLTLVVRNTTPIIPGESTGVISSLWINFPPQVTGSVLLSQSQGSGPNIPAFGLRLSPHRVACLGNFGARLINGPGISGSIANPAALVFPGPPGNGVMGPVTFVLQILSPDPTSLVTADFSQTTSTAGAEVVAAMKFQGAGVGAEESGFLGSQGSGNPCTVVATSVSLGSSCSLALDPILTIDPPVQGQNSTLRVESDFPFAGGLIFFSPGAPVPASVLGCASFVDISNSFSNVYLLSIFVADQNGDFEVVLPVPTAPAWLGLQYTFQVHMVVPNGPPTPYYPDWSSNGILLTIGCI